MTRLMRMAHKWLGLLIGMQFVLWVSSGLVMSLLDMHKVHGLNSRAPAPAQQPWAADTLPVGQVLGAQERPVDRIATAWLDQLPVYRLAHGKTSWLVDARSGQPVRIDAARAARLAAASYKRDMPMLAPQLLLSTPEVRGHTGRLWRVYVLDADATTIYVSEQTGEVLAHRNSTWRLFDFFWMLHIMDYGERTDFNHPLVVTSAGMGLLLTLGGLWLLVATFRVAELVPGKKRH